MWTHFKCISKDFNLITFQDSKTNDPIELPVIIILRFPEAQSPMNTASNGHPFAT